MPSFIADATLNLKIGSKIVIWDVEAELEIARSWPGAWDLSAVTIGSKRITTAYLAQTNDHLAHAIWLAACEAFEKDSEHYLAACPEAVDDMRKHAA